MAEKTVSPAILGTLPENVAEAILYLYKAVPSFALVEGEYWDETLEELAYPLLGGLALHVSRQVEHGDLSEVPAFLAETERLLRDADGFVVDLIHVEVLETLHHLPQVIPFLGPTSRTHWNQMVPHFGGEWA